MRHVFTSTVNALDYHATSARQVWDVNEARGWAAQTLTTSSTMVDGLLSRLGASIRARGARLIRMDVHLRWIALGSRVQKSWLAKVYVSGFLGRPR